MRFLPMIFLSLGSFQATYWAFECFSILIDAPRNIYIEELHSTY